MENTMNNKFEKAKEIAVEILHFLPRSAASLFFLVISVTLISASYKIEYIAPLFEQWVPHLLIGLFVMVVYLIVLIIFNRYYLNPATNDFNCISGSASVARMAPEKEKNKYSNESLMIASSHEVGHAFTLSLLPKELMPDEISLYINEYESSKVGALSYKYYDSNAANTPEHFYWQIAVGRAGILAEEHFGIKETALSKADRIQAWEAAKNYLIFKNNSNYFLSPVNEVEALVNHSTINALIKIVDENIIKSFKENSKLLTLFRDELLVKTRLDKSEVLAFINKVK